MVSPHAFRDTYVQGLMPWLGVWAGLGSLGAFPAALLMWLLATALLMLSVRVVLGFWPTPARVALIVLLSLGLTGLLLFGWNLGVAILGSVDPLHLHVGLGALLALAALLAQIWVLRHWLVLPTARPPGALALAGVLLLFWMLLIVAVSGLGIGLGLPVPRP